MRPQDYGLDIEALRQKMYRYNKQKKQCLISVYLHTGRQKERILNQAKVKDVDDIADFLITEKPDKIRIEFFIGDTTKADHTKTFSLLDTALVSQPIVQEFKGFGEVEIQNMVDQRFKEQKRAEEFERLQTEVTELTSELDEQRDLVEQLEEENEQLKIELEGKKQIRYYAGMLGDILEGIGISKDKIRNPIASLMGIADEKDNKEITHAPVEKQTDSSGIVEEVEQEETVEQKHRNEVVALMTEYLKTRDNITLSNLFNIFSEVEKDPKIAFEIIQFIESKKA